MREIRLPDPHKPAPCLCAKLPDTAAEDGMDIWSVVMIILLGVLALNLDRYDVFQRALKNRNG
jgi:hypothetical protein